MKELTLGSLFDGIGGWQIAAVRASIQPVWSSEIEKFPMEVTKKWFPKTKQLGDITKIDGASIEPVDIICAGSPCQDLSIAGNRAGLAGERSGLFVKSIEIFRAMREATGGEKPRWFVWENVPGAFSSHQGEDFRTVLEQIGQADIPVPQSHKWAQAGMVRTEAADICWRVLDAQYWGVPQRRKRIFLVADFGEQARRCAGEVLFDSEGMCGNPAESGEPREAAPDAIEGRAPATSLTPWGIQGRRIYDECGVSQTLAGCDGGGGQRGSVNIFQHPKPLVQSDPQGGPIVLKIRQPKIKGMGGNDPMWQEDMSYYLATHQDQTLFEATNYSKFREAQVARTISTGTAQKHQENIVVESTPRCIGIAENGRGELRQTMGYHVSLTTGGGKPGEGFPCIQELEGDNQKCFGANAFATFKESEIASTLNDVIRTVKGGKVNALAARMGTGGDNVQLVHTYCISGNTVGREPKNGGNGIGVQEDLGYTLDTVDRHAVCIGNGQTNQAEPSEVTGALNCMHEQQSIMQGYGRIRRLTPLECERLQGLPDGYTEGGSDAARYKAIGNGMAQPCADFVLRRIAECSGEE